MVGTNLAECARPLNASSRRSSSNKALPSAGIRHSGQPQGPAAGFKPAERGPGGGLTATYCTQLGMMKNGTPPTRNAHFYGEDGASWGLLGASWRPLGGLLGAKMGPSWAKLGPSSHLEGNLEATWPNMA